jgi:hypothetical protein
MEGETQQSLLAAGRDLPADIEERPILEDVVANDPDAPALLDDEECGRVVGPPGDIERRAQVTDDGFEPKLRRRAYRAGRGGHRGGAVDRGGGGCRCGIAGRRVRGAGASGG